MTLYDTLTQEAEELSRKRGNIRKEQCSQCRTTKPCHICGWARLYDIYSDAMREVLALKKEV